MTICLNLCCVVLYVGIELHYIRDLKYNCIICMSLITNKVIDSKIILVCFFYKCKQGMTVDFD